MVTWDPGWFNPDHRHPVTGTKDSRQESDLDPYKDDRLMMDFSVAAQTG